MRRDIGFCLLRCRPRLKWTTYCQIHVSFESKCGHSIITETSLNSQSRFNIILSADQRITSKTILRAAWPHTKSYTDFDARHRQLSQFTCWSKNDQNATQSWTTALIDMATTYCLNWLHGMSDPSSFFLLLKSWISHKISVCTKALSFHPVVTEEEFYSLQTNVTSLHVVTDYCIGKRLRWLN